jgi:hypothetical protein
MSLQERVDKFDATQCTTQELIAYRNLADFESRALVVGDKIFNAILHKVVAELQRRRI